MKNGVIKNGLLILSILVINYFVPPDYEAILHAIVAVLVMSQFVSIFENLALAGVNIPESIYDIIKNKNKGDAENE